MVAVDVDDAEEDVLVPVFVPVLEVEETTVVVVALVLVVPEADPGLLKCHDE